MREAIGSSQLFMIVIVLILLFTAFLCLSINYTAAFKVSDSIVNQIKKDNGANSGNISVVLSEAHYASVGTCNSGNDSNWTAFNQLGEITSDNGNASFCLKKVKVSQDSQPNIYYYQVKVFYRIDVPVISSLNLNSKTNTPNIYSPEDTINGGSLAAINE